MDIELRHLRALVAVVDAGSFTDAAIDLRVTQASVSRTIATLERTLGTKVLHRTSRELSLTSTGARVLTHARRVLAEVVALERAVDDLGGELRVGYHWSALGQHTTVAQQRFRDEHAGAELVFVQSNAPTAGLAEREVEASVLRRPLEDDRFEVVLVGLEPRYAALPSDDPLARRRVLRMHDLAARTLAVDDRTGTTSPDLWSPQEAPRETVVVHGTENWLTVIASGRAIGMTAEATVRQHPRPGIAYRRVRDAPPIPVWLAWWRETPPPAAAALVQLVTELYGSDAASR
jgi:DNA-binding transcriptional LysR family regulator